MPLSPVLQIKVDKIGWSYQFWWKANLTDQSFKVRGMETKVRTTMWTKVWTTTMWTTVDERDDDDHVDERVVDDHVNVSFIFEPLLVITKRSTLLRLVPEKILNSSISWCWKLLHFLYVSVRPWTVDREREIQYDLAKPLIEKLESNS